MSDAIKTIILVTSQESENKKYDFNKNGEPSGEMSKNEWEGVWHFESCKKYALLKIDNGSTVNLYEKLEALNDRYSEGDDNKSVIWINSGNSGIDVNSDITKICECWPKEILILHHDEYDLFADFWKKNTDPQVSKNRYSTGIDNFRRILKLYHQEKYTDFFSGLVQEYSTKKKLMKILHNLLPIAIDCQGILEVLSSDYKPPEGNNKKELAKDYYKKAFGNKSFNEVLQELKKKFKNISNDMRKTIPELKPENYKKLEQENFKEEYLKNFLHWFEEFCNAFKSVK